MRQLDTDMWVTESPLRFLGLEVGARMTVVRLPDGRLWLHSPVSATPELVREVEALGPVAFLIAPNRFHHLYVSEWKEACPDALVYVAPGLETKRSDLDLAGVLSDEPEPGWKDAIEQVALGGMPMMSEVVFFHRPSATLIVTDLAFNVGPDDAPLTRFFFRLNGAYGRVSATVLERLLARDRTKLRQSFERMLEWPFERIVVAHGDVSESGGRDQLVASYDWLLR
ncbi:MAG: DUF4336 domain-containing protein [Myxococcota bacterium]|jgi:hypothetical protein|nr:DUF4336 domain-containing protein [Myxococcota bacterium]